MRRRRFKTLNTRMNFRIALMNGNCKNMPKMPIAAPPVAIASPVDVMIFDVVCAAFITDSLIFSNVEISNFDSESTKISLASCVRISLYIMFCLFFNLNVAFPVVFVKLKSSNNFPSVTLNL